MTEKEWRTVPGYPKYTISDQGEIYSSRRSRLLKTSIGSKGYLKVNLENDGVWKLLSVHRLVALAFVDGFFEGAEVNHIDGDKTNPRATNLEWTTRKGNMEHASHNGLTKPRGPGKPKSKTIAIYDGKTKKRIG